MKIAVICSDDRMIQIYDNLSKSFCVMDVYNVNDLETCKREIDVLVLPVKGVDKEGKIACIRQKDEFWSELKESVLIFCGLRNEFLEKLPYRTYYYMEDQGVIRDNAILTAEGVLNELIGCCARSIYDIQVDVIGYGNCGKVIYDILHNLHVNTRVIRRTCEKQEDFIEVNEYTTCGDVIINTSIGDVLNRERMQQWTKRPVIIDIVTPDVIDMDAARELGICIIKAGNLPGRFASVTAGNIIAEFIRGKLSNEG
ncbi:MAG: hypothetical protein RR562_06360 [Longicatena sp.]